MSEFLTPTLYSDRMNSVDATPYYRLDPDTVIRSVESVGLPCNGQLLALNSYENRVYQVGQETGEPVVTKFYRPGRWSDAQILEEHRFSLELANADPR
jgi:Ser/Thr protein kinase RdoA (MazF antagonist)